MATKRTRRTPEMARLAVVTAYRRLKAAGESTTFRGVAEQAGVHKNVAMRHMRDVGLEPGKPAQWVNPQTVANREAIVTAWDAALAATGNPPSVKSIAKATGLSQDTVARHLAAAGRRKMAAAAVARARMAAENAKDAEAKIDRAAVAAAILEARAERLAAWSRPAWLDSPRVSVAEAARRDYRRAMRNIKRVAWPLDGGWLSPRNG